MAILSDEEVRLRLSFETDGEAGVSRLAENIEALAKGAGEAAPQFQALAQEVRSIGTQQVRLDGLQAAIDSAKGARVAFMEARREVEVLDKALADAKGAGANKEAVKLLETELRAANRELQTAERAWTKQKDALGQARTEAAAAGVDTRNLANEQARLKTALEAVTKAATEQQQDLADAKAAADKIAAGQREAAAAAEALGAAFRQLGIRPLQEVVAETQRLQAALQKVRESGISGPEQQQAISAFQAKLAALKAEAHGVAPAADNAAAGVRDLGREAESMGGMVGGAARQLVAMAGAIVGLQGASNLAKDVISTGAAFETLESRLTSLLGSSDKARDAFSQIKELARSTPFEVAGLTEAYVKLTAFGLQPSMAQMQAIADTAATLGGGTEALSRVTLALGQAWAKSKLQGDEILQLAEAGVPVWDLLAQATGRNVAELQKMSEAGTLGRSVILKLIDALGQENIGASAKLMATFNGAVANAKDALAEFYDMIAKSGVLEYLTDQLRDLLAEFDRMKDTGELQAQAKAIADGFVKTAEGVKTAVEAIAAMSGVIKLAVEGYVAWRVAGMTLIPMLGGVGTAAAAAAVETRALGASAGAAAGSFGLLGNALRLLKGAALVGIVTEVASLGMEFFKAKAAAEEADRVIRDMLKPVPLNGPAAEFQLVETKAALARVKTEELAAAFYQAAEQGKGAGEALKSALAEVKVDSPEGIGEILRGLDQIQGSARATGEEIRTGLVERLKALTAGELADFATMAEIAFNRGKLSADQFAFAIDTQLDAALLKAGVSATTAADGMTSKFRESADNVSLITEQLDTLRARGVDTDRVFIDLITKTIGQAGTRREFDFLADQVQKFADKAGLAQSEVDRLLTLIQQKTDGSQPGINSLAEAFGRLGMKSREALKQTEDSAREAFEYIRNNGGTLKEQEAAWGRYAEAAKAANGGILPPLLRVQGELMKVGEAGRSAGAGVRDGMTTAGSAVQKVLTDAERLANRLQSLKGAGLGDTFGNQSTGNGTFEELRRAGITGADMLRMGYSAREIEDYLSQNDKAAPGTVNRQVTSNGVNTYQMGIDAGLNDAEAKKLGEIYGYFAAKGNTEAQRRAAGDMGLTFGADDYTAVTREYANLAIAEARRLVAEESQKNGGAGATWGPAPRNVTSTTYSVDLRLNGGTRTVQVADQASAQTLVAALQELAARS